MRVKSQSFAASRFNSLLPASIAAGAISSFLTLCNCIIAGQFLGESALAAVNLMEPVTSLVIFVAYIIGISTAIMASKAKGEGDMKKADGYFSQGVLAAIVMGVFLTLLITFGRTWIVELLGASGENAANTSALLEPIGPFVLFILLYSFMVNLIISEEDLFFSGLSSAVLIGLKLVLAIVLTQKMGLAGLGWSTSISITAALGVCCLHFFSKHNNLHMRWHFNFKELLGSFRFSINDAIYFGYNAISLVIINRFILAHFDDTVLAIFAVINSVFSLVCMSSDGIGAAMQPILCLYDGEKNVKGIKATMQAAGRACLLSSAATVIFLLIFADKIPGLFGINDPLAMYHTAEAVRITAFSAIFSGLNLMLNSYYTYVDRIFLSVLNTTLRAFAFLLLFILLLGTVFGLNGIFMGIVLAEAIAFVFMWLATRFLARKSSGTLEGILLTDRAMDQCILDVSFPAKKENVMEFSVAVMEELKRRGYGSRIAAKASLTVEEMGMRILSKKQRADVLMEITVYMQDTVTVIIRDNDKTKCLADPDGEIRSLEDYLSALVFANLKESKYIETCGYNRTIFKIA